MSHPLTSQFQLPVYTPRLGFSRRQVATRPHESHGASTLASTSGEALAKHGVRTLVARADVSAAASSSSTGTELLGEVLQQIASSDGGSSLSIEEQAAINNKLVQLEELGRQQQPRPLDNPEIFGNFNVAYTSTERAREQNGQPAGGRFRGRLGRLLFRTTALCQSIIEPDTVNNKVEFRLFGLIRGSVGLRGKLEPVGDDKATVKVNFEPPRMRLAGGIDLPIGPTSDVVLTTTYVSPTVRLGKGSRGSLFVFTKGGAANQANMEAVGKGRTTVTGWLLVAGLLAGFVLAAAKLWRTGLAGKAAAFLPAALAVLLGKAGFNGLLEKRPA